MCNQVNIIEAGNGTSFISRPLNILCDAFLQKVSDSSEIQEKIVSFQVFVNRCRTVALSGAAIFMMSYSATAQVYTIPGSERRPMAVAERNNLYCSGYVQTASLYTAPKEIANRANKIVGADNEADQYNYADAEFLYISAGSNKGVQVGDMFSVIRPKGQVESRWTRKNDLGIFVEELGIIEVTKVKAEVSVARITTSCDSMLLGDLLVPFQQRTSPMYALRPKLNLFADPSGKASGRIFMARDGREALGTEHIVYIDLGAEDNVSAGDYLTIFRPLGEGNLHKFPQKESVSARDEGFQSDQYRGGKFSNQSARKYGSRANRRVVTTADAKAYRPDGLRKIVGEMVILNVKERTATALITRVAQEVHTGDWVEVQ